MDCNPVALIDPWGNSSDDPPAVGDTRTNSDGSVEEYGRIGGTGDESTDTYEWRQIVPPTASVNTLANNLAKVTANAEVLNADIKIYIFDQLNNPNDRRVYTAEFYVEVDGVMNGPYRGSSYPNAPDSNNEHNTVSEDMHPWNNLSGHHSGASQGLNIVDVPGSNNRQNTPGTDMDGNGIIMWWVNIHSGQELNEAGLHNRGSAGCPTIHPDDWEGFASNFDWSGTNGNTGNSTGIVTIWRGVSMTHNIAGYRKLATIIAAENDATYDAVNDQSILNTAPQVTIGPNFGDFLNR